MRKRILAAGFGAVLCLGMPLAAQTNRPSDERDELSTRRAPDVIRLEGGAVDVTGRQVSPLVAAASRGKSRSPEGTIRISNDTLARTGRGLVGMTAGKPVAELPPAPDSSQIIARHDQNVAQWQRSVRESRERLESLQEQVRSLEQQAGTVEERIGNEDDPARMEALMASQPQLQDELQQTRSELAQERERVQKLSAEKPRLD